MTAFKNSLLNIRMISDAVGADADRRTALGGGIPGLFSNIVIA